MRFVKKFGVLLAALAVPLIALAQSGGTGVTEVKPLKSPIAANNLGELMVKILDAVVQVGAYIAVLFIIWSGFLFVKARGNPKELEDAKRTFFYTIIGVAILLSAKGISMGIQATIESVVK